MSQGLLFPDDGAKRVATEKEKHEPREPEVPDVEAFESEPAAAPEAPRAGPSDLVARERAVREFAAPILLEAGAGTGKTATLVARVVHWCVGPGWDLEARGSLDRVPDDLAVAVLRGVSAITFTEAAAAEMSTRVGQALARLERASAGDALDAEALPKGVLAAALPAEPSLVHARARALRAGLDHLGVSTIHAFCRRLLAAHPLEVGMDPAFEVDATFSQTEICVREVLERVLAEAWTEPLDADLIDLARDGTDPPKIEPAIVSLVEEGARAADFEHDPLDEKTCSDLLAALADTCATLAVASTPLIGIKRLSYLAVDGVAATTRELDAATGDARERFEALCAALVGIWEPDNGKPRGRLKDWAKGKLIKDEKTLLGNDTDAERALIEAGRAFHAALEPFLEIDAERLNRARRVVRRVLAGVEDELRRRGIATFADLLLEADRLLRTNPAAAARERSRTRQLLVDEFQDTDDLQCRIVAAIALEGDESDRPGLFLVGDPKQSIFAWRNADLAAYDAFAERIVAAGGERLQLTHNFRSLPGILDEVERAIAPVLEEERGVQPAFVPLEAERVSSTTPAIGCGSIEYWVSWPRDDGRIVPSHDQLRGRSYEGEARALARDVVHRRESEGAGWKDFAVVFRSFTEIEPYLREMREVGVPYEVQSDRKYYQRREVIDATALVRAVLDPHDHLALVTLLRSPMVGTPDAALLPLWEEGFPGRASWLLGPDQERLEELEAIARRAAARVPGSIPGMDAIAGWEESLVSALHGLASLRRSFREDPADTWVDRMRRSFLPDATEAARFLGAYRLANLGRFFRQLARAVDERAGDVHSILRTLRANLARDDRSEASRPADSGQDAVQVLTIHGAKGLEFTHLYLAQAHKRDGGRSDVATAIDRRGGKVAYRLFGESSPAWFETKTRREAAEAAERVRLLYVALTRARDRLVVLGGWRPVLEQKPWSRAATFCDLLEHRAHAAGAASELARRAGEDDPEPFVDEAGATWRLTEFGSSGPRLAREEGEDAGVASSAAVVAAEAQALGSLRAAARRRRSRPFHARASDEAHVERAERVAGERYHEANQAPGHESTGARGIGQSAAQAAGTAVHRVLELADLEADATGELAKWRERLPTLVGELAREVDRAAAVERAEELLERIGQNDLFARLCGLREHIWARELPVLLGTPDSADGPVGFVSGVIDLVYRDPVSKDVVVADYKTDRVENDAELEERIAAYRGQGCAYVSAVREALGLDSDPRFELWFLSAGRVEKLDSQGPAPVP